MQGPSSDVSSLLADLRPDMWGEGTWSGAVGLLFNDRPTDRQQAAKQQSNKTRAVGRLWVINRHVNIDLHAWAGPSTCLDMRNLRAGFRTTRTVAPRFQEVNFTYPFRPDVQADSDDG